jgi:succinate-semialdehyde dehydrogenase/glutarate-semialdehyde dehydrogenase
LLDDVLFKLRGNASFIMFEDADIEMAVKGAIAPLYRFKTDAEAIKMANDTEFGLASYFYSRDIGRIWRVAEALEYGIVGINEGIISRNPLARSRALRRHEGKRHRPHLAVHWGSKYGIEEFLEVKYLCMGGIDR